MNSRNFNNTLLSLQDNLHRYALKLTTNSEEAQDLLQETFLKALTYKEKFQRDTNFKAWTYTIMKNTFINNYRHNVKVRSTFDKTNNEYHLQLSKDRFAESPDEVYGLEEIAKNINLLTDDYRVPFKMFLDGYKYKEIAEKLNLPLGTVKSRIFFGRKKLEKTLVDYVM